MTVSNKPFCVLLVEDDPADAHLTRVAFNEARVLVNLRHVEDGQAGMDYLLNAREARPDLILLDLNMPRMDGRSFLKAIKSHESLRRIPVVVLTTSDAENDILASYDLGAAGFIVKPVEIEQFIQQVQQLEDYWISLVRRPQR
jgi:CheY-like chemotaxis protein